MNSKVKEANGYLEEAEKHLKTGFFKWRPDYDSAAACYQKAALAFRNGRALEDACKTYIKLAESHYRNSARFHAGKAYEEAGQICKEMKDFGKALTHFDHASELYLEEGTPDTAAMCMDRAGKIVEATNPDWAVSSYLKAAQIYENEDDTRFRTAAELVGKAARLLVRCNKFAEALQSLAHEMKLWGSVDSDNGARSRLTCAIVLVHLQMGDQVRAEQSIYDSCSNVEGFEQSDEFFALQSLIEAYDQRDQTKASQVLNSPLFKYMDTAYAKLARYLRVPGYTPGSAGTAPGPNKPEQDPAHDTDPTSNNAVEEIDLC